MPLTLRWFSIPELLKAVEQLATGNTVQGVALLMAQGRVTEVKDQTDRVRAIAKDYVQSPANTLIVSPDNRSRQAINEAVRGDLIRAGVVAEEGRRFDILTHRSDLTGAGRTWAALYKAGDIVQYSKGSKSIGIARDTFAVVRATDEKANTITVERPDGSQVSYDPRRLRGVNVFEERSREFAAGDRLQFTALNKNLNLSNRDLGTITAVNGKDITIALDGKVTRTVVFDGTAFRQFDHGYAVTSHSSQGLTTGRVIANIDTDSGRSLINTRLAYVAISRAAQDARIYTNDATTLGDRLAQSVTKTAAIEFPPPSPSQVAVTPVPVQRTPTPPRPQQVHNEAVQAFRDENPEKGIKILASTGNIHVHSNSKDRIEAIVKEYASHPDRAVVLSADKSERAELTSRIREELKATGRLSPDGRIVSILVKQDLGNPKLAAHYAPGHRIEYRTGSPDAHGIPDGSHTIVKNTIPSKNLLIVERPDGETVSYNPALLKKQTAQSTVYRSEEREISSGERIQFSKAILEIPAIKAGAFATVEKVSSDGSIAVRLDSKKSVDLSPEQARHINYGYAVQHGKTFNVDRVIISGDHPDVTRQKEVLSHLSPGLPSVSVHTPTTAASRTEPDAPKQGIEIPETPSISVPPPPSIEHEGHSIDF